MVAPALIKRELIALLRARRAFWLLILVVVLSMSIPLLAWPSGGRPGINSYIANIWVFITFSITQLGAALLIIPAFTAGAISGERERSTYELLYSTLLSPLSIVTSKLLASTSYVLLLLAASVPGVCVLYLLGGIGFSSIVACYGVTAAAIVTAGIVCLTVSMRARRTAHAAIRGVFWVAFWNIGLMLLLGLVFAVFVAACDLEPNTVILPGSDLTGSAPFTFEDLLYYLVAVCPGYAIAAEVLPTRFLAWQNTNVSPSVISVSYLGILSALHVLYMLRRVQTPDPSTSTRRERRLMRRRASTRPRRIGRPLLVRALLALGRQEAPLTRNPMFLKELRADYFGRRWFRWLMFWAPLLIFLILLALAELNTFMLIVSLMITMVLMCLFSPAAAATSVTREFEMGNIDLLRGTLLPMPRLLRGKFAASFVAGIGVPCAFLCTLPIYALGGRSGGWFWGSDSAWHLDKAVLTAVVCAVELCVLQLFLASLGTFASVVSKRTMPALLKTYAILVAILIGLPLAFVALDSIVGGSEAVQDIVQAAHPFIAAGQIAGELTNNDGGSEEFAIFAVHVVGYLIVTAALAAFATVVFEVRGSRDP